MTCRIRRSLGLGGPKYYNKQLGLAFYYLSTTHLKVPFLSLDMSSALLLEAGLCFP